ncbi:hypothetical protein FDUTEX481_07759 [Tolypothrix sp. PCC 7601]|nr:hypothetical protein FDUTEX481_07759 [Tolypothrix sp. PCC 7601]
MSEDKSFVRARHPQSFGISNILLVPCPYPSVAFFFQNGMRINSHRQIAIANPKSEIPNPKSKIQNPKSKIKIAHRRSRYGLGRCINLIAIYTCVVL